MSDENAEISEPASTPVRDRVGTCPGVLLSRIPGPTRGAG
jgi:hypothetical protein